MVSALCVALGTLSGADAPPQEPHVFRLRHEPSGFALPMAIERGGPGGRFEKEPGFGGRPVARRLLPTARQREDCMGFIWDRVEGKLYLDLNGNRDLTDDPDGVFRAAKLHNTYYFETLRVQLGRPGTTRYYVFSLRIRTDRHTGRDRCWMTVRSGWRGKIGLHGKTWTLSVADNLDGLIRGPADTCQILPEPLPQNTAPHFVRLPRSLVLDGHVYDLDFTFAMADGPADLVATFSETRPAMGTLAIEGQSIKRLVLRNHRDDLAAVLHAPGERVKLPVGTYERTTAHLSGGPHQRWLHAEVLDPFTIAHGRTTKRKIGGPLKHFVKLAPRGRRVRLSYSLQGVGGETYEQVHRLSSESPRFRVSKWGMRIASGSFRYG